MVMRLHEDAFDQIMHCYEYVVLSLPGTHVDSNCVKEQL